MLFKNTLNWRKLGRIAEPYTAFPWNRTHMSLPTVDVLGPGKVRVYFGGRDDLNRSQVGYVEFDPGDPHGTLRRGEQPVLTLGELGTFDDNGVMPCSVVHDGDDVLLYYVGWNPRSTVRFSFYSGLAISRDGGESFQRYSRAPILERTDREPFVNASPMVIRDGDVWRMYYVSGEGWIHHDLPKYDIKYAESRDGRYWRRDGKVAIGFDRPGEHALARPCVIKDGEIYRMWFAKKGADASLGNNYRMGYAESEDGVNFARRDDLANFDVSPEGWDSEMVCYGFVFFYQGRRYMVYNGNNYGHGGFGLAVEA
jgi:hypothetical protein